LPSLLVLASTSAAVPYRSTPLKKYYPDLLDDAASWQTDDLWVYSFYAFLIFIRAAAYRTGRSVEQVAVSIADRRLVRLVPND
jgi:hypothetical protein